MQQPFHSAQPDLRVILRIHRDTFPYRCGVHAVLFRWSCHQIADAVQMRIRRIVMPTVMECKKDGLRIMEGAEIFIHVAYEFRCVNPW